MFQSRIAAQNQGQIELLVTELARAWKRNHGLAASLEKLYIESHISAEQVAALPASTTRISCPRDHCSWVADFSDVRDALEAVRDHLAEDCMRGREV